MNLYQKPKDVLGKYKINEIVYFSRRTRENYNTTRNYSYRAVATPFGILICDASTGEEHHLLPSPENEVLSIACSPDGRVLAGGKADNTIQLWNIESLNETSEYYILGGHKSSVVSVVFSPNGEMLASGSIDGTIHLWDTSDGSHKSTLEHGGVTSVVFSPDSKMLVSGSDDGTIRLWESEIRFGQNRCIITLDSRTDGTSAIFTDNKSEAAVTSVVFSPKGSTLVSGHNNGAIHLWNIKNLRNKSIGTLEKHTGSIESLDFSFDGRTLASGSKDRTICIWDTLAAQHLATLKEHKDTVFSVVFRDNQLVSESSDGSIRFWNTETGKNGKTIVGGYTNHIKFLEFSRNGQMLTSIGKTIIYSWDVKTGEMKTAVSGTRLNEINDKTKKTSIKDESFVFFPEDESFVAFTSDGKIRLTVEYNRTRYYEAIICLWDVGTGKQKATLTEEITDLTSIHFSPDNKTLATIEEATIRLWDVGTGKQKATLTEEITDLTSIHFSPDNKTLATIKIEDVRNVYSYRNRNSKATICLWDVSTGERKATIDEKINNAEFVHFSPDSKTLLTIGTEESANHSAHFSSRENSSKKIYLWDVGTGEQKTNISKKIDDLKSVAFTEKLISAPEEMINNIEFIILNSDKTKFASVHSDNLIRLWDVETGKHQSTFAGAQEDITAVAFSLDNRTLACGSRNGMILLWDLKK